MRGGSAAYFFTTWKQGQLSKCWPGLCSGEKQASFSPGPSEGVSLQLISGGWDQTVSRATRQERDEAGASSSSRDSAVPQQAVARPEVWHQKPLALPSLDFPLEIGEGCFLECVACLGLRAKIPSEAVREGQATASLFLFFCGEYATNAIKEANWAALTWLLIFLNVKPCILCLKMNRLALLEVKYIKAIQMGKIVPSGSQVQAMM